MNRLRFIERSNEARKISFVPIWPRQHGNHAKLSKFIGTESHPFVSSQKSRSDFETQQLTAEHPSASEQCTF